MRARGETTFPICWCSRRATTICKYLLKVVAHSQHFHLDGKIYGLVLLLLSWPLDKRLPLMNDTWDNEQISCTFARRRLSLPKCDLLLSSCQEECCLSSSSSCKNSLLKAEFSSLKKKGTLEEVFVPGGHFGPGIPVWWFWQNFACTTAVAVNFCVQLLMTNAVVPFFPSLTLGLVYYKAQWFYYQRGTFSFFLFSANLFASFWANLYSLFCLFIKVNISTPDRSKKRRFLNGNDPSFCSLASSFFCTSFSKACHTSFEGKLGIFFLRRVKLSRQLKKVVENAPLASEV